MAKPGRHMIELPKGNVIHAYESGDGIQRIGDKYGVCRNTVKRRLLAWGVKLRPRGRPVKLAEVARAEGVHRRILQLEESISDKQKLVDKRGAELKRVQEEGPQREASAVVARLKKADVELRDFQMELTKLMEVA